MSPPAARDWRGYVARAAWRLANPRSQSGLFLRLAAAVSAALWLLDALVRWAAP